MTRHSPFRKLLKIILHSSLPIRTPIKDLHEKPTSCTRLRHHFRYIYDRQVVAVERKRVEVMTPSPKRSEAALVFFVLKWRGWLVGITYLKQVDLFVRVESSSKPALNSFSSSSRLSAFSIRLAWCGTITPFPTSSLEIVQAEAGLGPVDRLDDIRDVFLCRCMRRPNTNSRMRGGKSRGEHVS